MKYWIREEPVYEKNSDGLYVVKEWKGVMSVADQKDNKVEVVNPSVSPVMNQYVVIVLTILVAIAGVLSVVPGMPPAVQTVSAAVIAIAAALGVASPGVHKKNQETLK